MSLKGSLLLLVLASMLSTADLLQCYACGGVKCTSTPLTCPEGRDNCIKRVYKYENLGEGREIEKEMRNCAPQSICTEKSVDMYETYCCQKDLCNSAGAIGKNILLLLVPLASTFVVS